MSSSRDTFQRQEASLLFRQAVDDLVAVLGRLDDAHLDSVTALAADILVGWRAGGKLLVCGNGGSAADSQHIVAELVGRFLAERPGYPAIALTSNTSTLTAVGNDYGFDHIFARQVQALGGPHDVLLVISTSGNSANCVLAVEEGRRHGMKVHGFLGGDGGRLLPLLDGALIAPSAQTPKIQEIHITMGHLLCMILEKWQDNPA
ncbi:MAG: SIS domain-containing protein [Candidatus Krumholzibacteria bacterium]|nr:SIS domain-containing protein [Candidatus Krumholzibacteria bacterium]